MFLVKTSVLVFRALYYKNNRYLKKSNKSRISRIGCQLLL